MTLIPCLRATIQIPHETGGEDTSEGRGIGTAEAVDGECHGDSGDGMAHELSFGKIHIIEWLWRINPETGTPDRRTGQESHEEIRAMLAATPDSPVQVILHRVSSRAAFLVRLNRIEQDFRVTGRVPLLQIESHGDGIGLSRNNGLTWPELMKALTPLNQATGVRLPVFLAACDGMWGIRMAQAMERAPFFALLGPNRKVTPGEVVRGMCAFYRKVIVDRDGSKPWTR